MKPMKAAADSVDVNILFIGELRLVDPAIPGDEPNLPDLPEFHGRINFASGGAWIFRICFRQRQSHLYPRVRLYLNRTYRTYRSHRGSWHSRSNWFCRNQWRNRSHGAYAWKHRTYRTNR